MSHYRAIITPSADANSDLVKSKWTGLAFKATLTTITHPIEYAKVLIQIGHEPIAPWNARTFFGKPALALPSVFQYMGHIRKRDGFLGLYAGLAPKLVGLGVTVVVGEKLSKYLPQRRRDQLLELHHRNHGDHHDPEEEEELDESRLNLEEKFWLTLDDALHDATERLAILVVTQPFQVLAVRTMAQFVGGEKKYNGLFSGFGEILKENGILGFWSGFIPRAIGEVSTVVLTAAITFLVNTYVLDDKQMKKYTKTFASFIATSLCYPFLVVSNCMVVSHSGLAAGYPPCMPLHRSWTDCWSHLSREKQLKRGSSLIFRYFTGPQVIVGDKCIPVNSRMFKPPTATK